MPRRLRCVALLCLTVVLATVSPAAAQYFSSGSTGADGADRLRAACEAAFREASAALAEVGMAKASFRWRAVRGDRVVKRDRAGRVITDNNGFRKWLEHEVKDLHNADGLPAVPFRSKR